MNERTAVKKVALFIGLTYLVSYLLVALYFAFGGTWRFPGSLVSSVIYMFMPLAIAILVQKVLYKAPLKEPLRIFFKPNRWFVVVWLLPVVVAVASLAVSLPIPGVEFSPEMAGLFERFEDVLTPEQLDEMKRQSETLPVHPFWLALIQGLVAGATINAAGTDDSPPWGLPPGRAGIGKSSVLLCNKSVLLCNKSVLLCNKSVLRCNTRNEASDSTGNPSCDCVTQTISRKGPAELGRFIRETVWATPRTSLTTQTLSGKWHPNWIVPPGRKDAVPPWDWPSSG